MTFKETQPDFKSKPHFRRNICTHAPDTCTWEETSNLLSTSGRWLLFHSSLPLCFSSAYYWVKTRSDGWRMGTGRLYGPFKHHFHVWCWKQQNCPSTKWKFNSLCIPLSFLSDKNVVNSNTSLMHFMQLNAFEHWWVTRKSTVLREQFNNSQP